MKMQLEIYNSGAKSTSRLASLTQIIREVDSAADLESALGILVSRTREVMGADVCSVYFTDETRRRHVAAATDGLSSRVVGNVQFEFGKGLIGEVAESHQPVNIARVPRELEQSFLEQTARIDIGLEQLETENGPPLQPSIFATTAL